MEWETKQAASIFADIVAARLLLGLAIYLRILPFVFCVQLRNVHKQMHNSDNNNINDADSDADAEANDDADDSNNQTFFPYSSAGYLRAST